MSIPEKIADAILATIESNNPRGITKAQIAEIVRENVKSVEPGSMHVRVGEHRPALGQSVQWDGFGNITVKKLDVGIGPPAEPAGATIHWSGEQIEALMSQDWNDLVLKSGGFDGATVDPSRAATNPDESQGLNSRQTDAPRLREG